MRESIAKQVTFTTSGQCGIVQSVMLKLPTARKLRTEIVSMILVTTLIPGTILGAFWINSQRHAVLRTSQASQKSVTADGSNEVNTFINNEIRVLEMHSQNITLEQSSPTQAAAELRVLLYQEPNIERLVLVNKYGQEMVALNNKGATISLQNDAKNAAFRSVDVSPNNQYISTSAEDVNGNSEVLVAVPILASTTPKNLAQLLNDKTRSPNSPLAANGALIAQVNFEDLWSESLSSASNKGVTGNYTFVVGSKGNIIAYPKNQLANIPHNLANIPIVADYLRHIGTSTTSGAMQGISERGVPTLGTYRLVKSAKWAIIDENPLANIDAAIDHTVRVDEMLVLVAIILILAARITLSTIISRPVFKIAKQTALIGKGDLDTQLDEGRQDELGVLGRSINLTTQNLKASLGKSEEQRRQLEAILNNTTDAIMSIEEDGKILIANEAAEELLERSRNNLLGKNIHDIMAEIKNAKGEPINLGNLRQGTYFFAETLYVSPSKLNHYIDMVAVKIQNADQAATNQTIITVHDNTKARELENMKLDFVSLAAHELRTPLSAMQGYMELLSSNTALPDNMRHYVDQSLLNAKELASLISNLLNVSRVEHGNLRLNMEKIDFAMLAKEAIQSSGSNAKAKSQTLTYYGPDNGLYVAGDQGALLEVINNLVDNAIKYTPEAGKITVQLRQEADKQILSVKDTGVGIPKNALPHLFTEFFRIHSGLQMGTSGTGLGLYLAKSILTAHKGEISATSEEGHGSEFIVNMPLYSDALLDKIRNATLGGGLEEEEGERPDWAAAKNTTHLR